MLKRLFGTQPILASFGIYAICHILFMMALESAGIFGETTIALLKLAQLATVLILAAALWSNRKKKTPTILSMFTKATVFWLMLSFACISLSYLK